jgi:hypothetical protein
MHPAFLVPMSVSSDTRSSTPSSMMGIRGRLTLQCQTGGYIRMMQMSHRAVCSLSTRTVVLLGQPGLFSASALAVAVLSNIGQVHSVPTQVHQRHVEQSGTSPAEQLQCRVKPYSRRLGLQQVLPQAVPAVHCSLHLRRAPGKTLGKRAAWEGGRSHKMSNLRGLSKQAVGDIGFCHSHANTKVTSHLSWSSTCLANDNS